MAVPWLADGHPFFRLDPTVLAVPPRKAATIAGVARSARKVGIDELEPVDVVVTGCVAVGRDGARLGKSGGFSDLEMALAAATGLIDVRTLVVTTVHPVQVVDADVVPTTGHDIHVDLIATPDEIIACPRPRHHALRVLHWDELTDEKISSIPVPRQLAAAR